jgi:3-oxoacyl-[acyl-carrier protein] reductase
MKSQAPVAIVTGASAGIGEAIAKRLARGGFRIVAVARRAERLEALKASLAGITEVVPVALDVTQPDAAKRAVAAAIDTFGRLDCLVNNAGSGDFAPLRKTDDAIMDEVIEASLKAPIRFVVAAVKVMQSGASIINIGSTFGLIAGLNGGVYSAVKAGLVGLTQSVAIEFGPKGIRCNVVAPGVIRTAMTDDYWETEPFRRVNQELTPFNRDGTVEDIANAVHFLASEEGSYVNGQTLALDGGWSTTKYLCRDAIVAKRLPPDT